jgi:hypothetical protein
MIDCTEYRRRITAEPELAKAGPDGGGPPGLGEHRESCAQCAEFSARLLAFEDRFAAALKLDLPPSAAASNVIPLARRKRVNAARPWFAMAASVVLGVGVFALLWLGTAQSSLASDVVKHMAHEPAAWNPTDSRVADADLSAVLKDAHVRLLPPMNRVSYAQSCLFRGHRVPHLVVQGESGAGPVTVLVLAHEGIAKPQRFDEQGYRGMIVPMPGHGSLAVITRGAGEPDAQRVAASLVKSIQWTP